MGSDTELQPEWRHLLPVPHLVERQDDASRPVRVLLEIDPDRCTRRARSD